MRICQGQMRLPLTCNGRWWLLIGDLGAVLLKRPHPDSYWGGAFFIEQADLEYKSETQLNLPPGYKIRAFYKGLCL